MQFKLKDFLKSSGITRQAFYKNMKHAVTRVSRGVYDMETAKYNSYKKYYASKKRIKQGAPQ